MLSFGDYKKSMKDRILSTNEGLDSTNEGRSWKLSYWYWNSPYDLKTMTLGNKIKFYENQDMPSWVVTEEDARLYLVACTHTGYVPAYQYPGKYDISLITRDKAEETLSYLGITIEDIKSIESLYADVQDDSSSIKHSGILIKDVTDNEGNIIDVKAVDGCESLTDLNYKYSKFTVNVKLRSRLFVVECPDWVNSKADVYAFMYICMNDSMYIDTPSLCDYATVKDFVDMIDDGHWYNEFSQRENVSDEFCKVINDECLKNPDFDSDIPLRFVSYTDDKGQTYKI